MFTFLLVRTQFGNGVVWAWHGIGSSFFSFLPSLLYRFLITVWFLNEFLPALRLKHIQAFYVVLIIFAVGFYTTYEK